VLAAGDIAGCDTSGDEQTANILDNYLSATVLPLGDEVYEQASASQFANCYDPTWGRAKSRSHPIVGNHEYVTTNAAGYFGYFNAQLAPFGAAATDYTRGWYSYDLGAWHVVALNDQCGFITGGCGSGSPEVQWLQSDLASHPAQCTLAYMHEPLFSSGSNASTDDQALWQALYAGGADLVLNGHDHDYERFAPQTPAGALDVNNGITEFVVGTGGRSHFTFNGTLAPNSQVRDSTSFGVIKLDLHAGSYAWAFIPVAGSTFTDSGSRACH
jgi:acid phosphatase type 7